MAPHLQFIHSLEKSHSNDSRYLDPEVTVTHQTSRGFENGCFIEHQDLRHTGRNPVVFDFPFLL